MALIVVRQKIFNLWECDILAVIKMRRPSKKNTKKSVYITCSIICRHIKKLRNKYL